MSSLCTHGRPQSLSPLADSRVDDSLLQIIPHFYDALLQLVNVTYTTFIYTLLHYSPDLVVDEVQIWTIWQPEVRTDDVWCLPLQQLDGVAEQCLVDRPATRLNCWKHLLRQEDIAVILAIHLHPRVDKYQFSRTNF